MIPNKEGVYEWFEPNGIKRLVYVCDVSKPLCEGDLKVCWWGSYYSIVDEDTGNGFDRKAEWSTGEWGNYVGPFESFKEEDLYLNPTPEELKEFKFKYNYESKL
jgi:hypothetical protein